MSSKEYTTVDQPVVKLNTGAPIPLIGLGTWKAQKPGQVKNAVEVALRCGYRHIDCAWTYGNQEEVGAAFDQIFKTEGKIKRSDVFVTTKLWNHHHKDVRGDCLDSLKQLRLDYLDLYLMHWPAQGPGYEGKTEIPSIKETWQEMEKLVDEGKVKAIGISNFSVKKTKELLTYAKHKPAANQVELHPYFRNSDISKFCQSENILITAYSPLGTPDSPEAGFKENIEAKKPMDDPLINKIAKDLGKSPAQICVRWNLQLGHSVIPKSVTDSRIVENLQIVKFEIPKAQMDELNAISHQMRMLDGAFVCGPNTPYPTIEDLWDGEVPQLNKDRLAKSQK